MNYEYMKEYLCDDVKPDLQDDVLVQVWSWGRNKWHDPSFVGDGKWVTWNKFRIVDERYKPKSDWFERGENPPINTECEVWYKGEWHKTLIVGYDRTIQYDDPFVVYKIPGNVGYRSCSRLGFRPLRAERDELIDKALSCFDSSRLTLSGKRLIREHAAVLIDAGMLKKPD